MKRFALLFAMLLALVLGYSSSAEAQTTRTVCASGCNHTTLAAAATAAVCGDTITMKAGEVFTASMTLPNKGDCSTNPITIKSDTSSSNLPAAGTRIDPTYSAFLPQLKAASGGNPAISFAAGANGYTFIGLEFQFNPQGQNDIIRVGESDSSQQFYADQPRNIVFDRVIVRGDAFQGQKRGIFLNGKNLTVKNSYIDRIRGVGQDAMCLAIVNGEGPFLIENNFLECAAYSLMVGGADPQIRTFAEVSASPAPTTTSATLTNYRPGHTTSELSVGQLIAVLTSSTVRRHTYVRSINGNAITFDAIPEAPMSGAGSDIRWGLAPKNITFKRNWVKKDITLMDPILETPTGVTVTASTSSGTLAAGTYCYRVATKNNSGYGGADYYSSFSTEQCATLTAAGNVTISWTGKSNATHYRILGRASGSPTAWVDVTAPTTTFSDNASNAMPGTTGTAGCPGTSSIVCTQSKWVEKNMWELKAGQNVLVTGNVFEYAWKGADIGYAFWLKSNNAEGNAEFTQTKDVIIENNIVRHASGGFNILGRNVTSGEGAPAPMENVTIRNNLFDDIATVPWQQSSSSIYFAKLEAGTINLRFEHNTVITNGIRGFIYLPQTAAANGLYILNNLVKKETYGIFGGSCSQGLDCLNKNTIGSVYQLRGNVIAGASSSAYSTGAAASATVDSNLFPSVTDFQTLHFENYNNANGGDYNLKSDSTWKGTATDGLDRGADIAAIINATTGVTSGSSAPSGPNPITITTTGLNQGTQNVSYSTTITITGATAPVDCSVSAGSLPAGITITDNTPAGSCTISGTPTVVGTSSFTISVTDSQSPTPATDTQALSIKINAAPTPVSVATTSLGNGTVGLAYDSGTIVVSGGTGPYTCSVASGLPTGTTIDTQTCKITGVPVTAGIYSFTVVGTDTLASTGSRSLSITIVAETRPCNRPPATNRQEGIIFRRVTPPAAADCVTVGDIWIDRSTNPPTLKVSRNATDPIQWSAPTASSMNELPIAVAGGIPVGLDDATWGQLLPGVDGAFLRMGTGDVDWSTNGSTLTDLNASALATGTVPAARLGSGTASSSTYLRGNNTWGSAPVTPVTVTLFSGTALTNSNVLTTGEEFNASQRNRFKLDTTNYTQISIMGHQTTGCGATGSLEIQYSTDNSTYTSTGASWSCTSSGAKDTAFVTLPVGARGQDVWFRAYYTAHTGAGTEDPAISSLFVRFR